MKVYNKWVGYLDRNYQQVKSKILETLGQSVPEVTDHSDTNIFIVVIGIFSGLTEMLNYYIDNMARESFITTARKYSSVVKLSKLIDYRIKAMIPSSVDLRIDFLNSDDTPYSLVAPILLPQGMKFSTSNNVEFISVRNVELPIGATFAIIPLRQKTAVYDELIGITNPDIEQTYSLGKDYVNASIHLEVGGIPWYYQETLGRSKPTDRHFIVDISATKEAYIRFGDNINGMAPTPGQNLVGDYYKSLGALGNVEPNTIINSETDFTLIYGIPKTKISNSEASTAGTDYEDIERIRRSAPLSLRTLYRAVTRQDYEDLALLSPGVNKAKIKYDCGKYVNLYISPNGGGIPSSDLLKSVEEYFDNKKMVTTYVKALPVGESFIIINLDVTAKFRMDGMKTRKDVEDALLDAYSYEKSDINKPIRISDVISLVDNLDKVDYLKSNYLSIIPYIKPVELSYTNLLYNLTVNIGSVQNNNWLIKFDGVYFKLLKNNTQVTNLLIGDIYTDPLNIITIEIKPGFYNIGEEWVFITLPVNKDLILNDYSIPILKAENLSLIINEQLAI